MLKDTTCELAAKIDELAVAEVSTLAGGETLQALCRELERLTAVVTRAAAAFDAGGEWEADGARSAATWMATRCRMSLGSARRRVRLGRAMRCMTATESTWLAGDIGEGHVEPMAATRGRVGSDVFGPDESWLVEQAREMGVREFLAVLAYWEQAADPDGVEERAEAKWKARRLHLSQSFDGVWFLDGVLDPIGGEVVSRALKRIEDELFAVDWAEAKERVGGGVCAGDLARTPAQRRADALVEMARRAMAVPAGGRVPEPLFTVLVGYETFAGRVCELASGTVVTPGALVPWLTQAHIERVVFDGSDRVKNVGPHRRLFTGATRRAVEVRDRTCYSQFCNIPAQDCEIDHVEPYREGGLTVDENGRPACGYHNRFRQRAPTI